MTPDLIELPVKTAVGEEQVNVGVLRILTLGGAVMVTPTVASEEHPLTGFFTFSV